MCQQTDWRTFITKQIKAHLKNRKKLGVEKEEFKQGVRNKGSKNGIASVY